MRSEREAVLARLAGVIDDRDFAHPCRVAVDGVTASGKTTLADELSTHVERLGRPAIRLSMDGFHHPRARRYKQGRTSAIGYYEDAYDFQAFVELVLVPLGDGAGSYRPHIIDLATDQPVDEGPVAVPCGSVLIVDGSFLGRPELRAHWDLRIFVHADLDVARARGVARDAVHLGGTSTAEQMYRQRYHAAGRHYLDTVRPAETATAIVENNDPQRPRVYLRQAGATWPPTELAER